MKKSEYGSQMAFMFEMGVSELLVQCQIVIITNNLSYHVSWDRSFLLCHVKLL